MHVSLLPGMLQICIFVVIAAIIKAVIFCLSLEYRLTPTFTLFVLQYNNFKTNTYTN